MQYSMEEHRIVINTDLGFSNMARFIVYIIFVYIPWVMLGVKLEGPQLIIVIIIILVTTWKYIRFLPRYIHHACCATPFLRRNSCVPQ